MSLTTTYLVPFLLSCPKSSTPPLLSETYFFNVSTLCPTLPSPSPEKERKSSHTNLSTKDIILIASGALLIVMLILVCVLCCLLRKKVNETKSKGGEAGPGAVAAKTDKGGEAEAGGETGGKLVHFDGPMAFTADDLLCATAEFFLGKSALMGTVYKATLEDGSQVAVKRLRAKITKSQKEFENEINVLGRIRHPNLLALRAYYLGPKGEKLVVFDYMSRGGLATFLIFVTLFSYFEIAARGPEVHINWPTRMSLIKGMARGLFFTHTQISSTET